MGTVVSTAMRDAFRVRICALWPLRHDGRKSELQTLVCQLRRIEAQS